MKRLTDPSRDLPQSFTLTGEINASAIEEYIGIALTSFDLLEGQIFVSFGEGRPGSRWWFKGNADGFFERISPPTTKKWHVSPPEIHTVPELPLPHVRRTPE